MKIWIKKTLIWALVIGSLLLTSAGIFIRYYGKDLISAGLEFVFEQKVFIDAVAYDFPFGVRGRKLAIHKKFYANDVTLQFNPLLFIFGKIEIRELVFHDPVLYLSQEFIGRVEGNQMPPQSNLLVDTGSQASLPEIRIEYIVFQNAAFTCRLPFKNKEIWVRGEAVDVTMEDLILPMANGRAHFRFMGKLVIQQDINLMGQVSGDGWFDLSLYNMESRFKFRSDDLKTTVTALCVSQKDDMTVSGNIITDKITLFPEQKGGQTSLLGDMSMGAFVIQMNYQFKAKMSEFYIGGDIPFEGNIIFEDAVAEK